MNKVLAIVFTLFFGLSCIAQDKEERLPNRSYLLANGQEKDLSFLKAKCRQANLDLGLSVLANRIPTNSKLVAPKPSKHLLKQGTLQLQLAMDDQQTEFAVYHSELFDYPATINVLQIDNELVIYRTTEKTGNIHLFYNCTRGAFGTKAAAHKKDATVYKLWDTPERTLLPDLELQDQMAQKEAKKLAKTDYEVLIFNDLKSYAYNESADTAIAHFLDTMRKYNPEKLLQGDLLTPMSAQYLDRVNENQLWNASMRTKIIETLTEKQDFYRNNLMPCMIGNFQIHLANKNRNATTLEELEWLLSKATAYDAGFGLIFDVETMKRHGLTDTMLDAVNIWETLRLKGAFSEAQKNEFKDPYGNWHVEKADDSTCLLYPQHVSRRYFCDFGNDTWEWDTPYAGRFALRIEVEGQGSVSELEIRTPNGILYFPCTLKAGQFLVYGFDGTAFITDLNHNKLQNVEAQGIAYIDKGISQVSFSCKSNDKGNRFPMMTIRYITQGQPETIGIP